jgi:hypothetical protein
VYPERYASLPGEDNLSGMTIPAVMFSRKDVVARMQVHAAVIAVVHARTRRHQRARKPKTSSVYWFMQPVALGSLYAYALWFILARWEPVPSPPGLILR